MTPNDQNTIALRLGIAELIRHLALVGLAGAVGGAIVGGIGGRLVMRIAAVAAPPAAAPSRNSRRRLSVSIRFESPLILDSSAFAGRMTPPPHNPST